MRLLITVIFAGLAGWFVLGPQTAPVPWPRRPRLAPGILDGSPLRPERADSTLIRIGGQPLHCNECHKLFESRSATQQNLAQHTEIVLRHGLNNRCLNCHAISDREKLELHDGTLVGLDDSPSLCSQCHGPTWRDWTLGIHGRTSGFWDLDRGAARRLKCTECHDPHSPAFPGIAPAPGPWTLRMGEPSEQERGESQTSPLQRWSLPHDQHGSALLVPAPGPVSAPVGAHESVEEASDG